MTEADLVMQKRLETELLLAYPETTLLSEEMSLREQQDALNSGRLVWCLDPLDGTSNFASGIPYFAVSLSLIKNNDVIMGVVYDPTRDECFYADTNTNAMLNGKNIELEYFDENINNAIAIIDLKMEPMNGNEVLTKIKELSPTTETLMISAFGTVETAVDSMQKGASDFLTKPFTKNSCPE